MLSITGNRYILILTLLIVIAVSNVRKCIEIFLDKGLVCAITLLFSTREEPSADNLVELRFRWLFLLLRSVGLIEHILTFFHLLFKCEAILRSCYENFAAF